MGITTKILILLGQIVAQALGGFYFGCSYTEDKMNAAEKERVEKVIQERDDLQVDLRSVRSKYNKLKQDNQSKRQNVMRHDTQKDTLSKEQLEFINQ